MKQFACILIALCISSGILGDQAETRAEEQRNTARIFSEIAGSVSKVQTFTCNFIQEKHLSMLNNVLTSKGRFFYKREDKLRWEFNEPIASGFAVNGEKAFRWKEDSERTQKFHVQQVPFIKVFTDQVFSWANADFKKLEKRYRIQVVNDEPADLKLFPKSSQEKEYLSHIRIVFALDASHVKMVEVHETDGDFTLIRFLKMVINKPLPDGLFN
jgi:outer membrane lipoprotein-sorting protein